MSKPVPRKDEDPKDFFDAVWESLGTVRGVSWLMTAILGFAGLLVWLLSVSELLAGVLLGFSGAFLFLAFLAKAKHDGESPYLSLQALTATSLGDGETQMTTRALSPASPKPQPNIVMLGRPRQTIVTCDEKFVFREDYTASDGQIAVVVDFQNQLIPAVEIKGLKGVRSQLAFGSEGAELLFLNRGFWLKQESPEAIFERGDTHSLFICYLYEADNEHKGVRTIDRRAEPPLQTAFTPSAAMDVRIILFTQTRHRFHKECVLGLTPELYVKKPLA